MDQVESSKTSGSDGVNSGRTTAADRKQLLIGASFVIVSAVSFSAKAIMVKVSYRYGADALSILFFRMAFALPFFLGIVVFKKPASGNVRGRDWVLLILSGLSGYYLASLLDFKGLQHVTAGLERLILFTYPTLVVLFSFLFLRKRYPKTVFGAMALCYVGIGFSFTHDIGQSQGDVALGGALIFGSSISYTVFLLLSEGLIQKFGSARYTAIALSISCLLVVIHYGIVNPPAGLFRYDWHIYALGLALALVSTVLPSLLLAAGIKRIGSSNAAILGMVGPVSTIVMGAVVLGEAISMEQLAGTALVLGGVFLVTRAPQRP